MQHCCLFLASWVAWHDDECAGLCVAAAMLAACRSVEASTVCSSFHYNPVPQQPMLHELCLQECSQGNDTAAAAVRYALRCTSLFPVALTAPAGLACSTGWPQCW